MGSAVMESSLDMTVALGLVVSRGLLLASIKDGGNTKTPDNVVAFVVLILLHLLA